MKKWNWTVAITVVLALLAAAFAYGALNNTVNHNSTEIAVLKAEHQKTMAILAQIDKNQALLTQRLEALEDR